MREVEFTKARWPMAFKLSDAVKISGVPENVWRRLIKEKKIHASNIGGLWYIKRETIVDLLENGERS